VGPAPDRRRGASSRGGDSLGGVGRSSGSGWGIETRKGQEWVFLTALFVRRSAGCFDDLCQTRIEKSKPHPKLLEIYFLGIDKIDQKHLQI
jgi:hypothetical protein